MKKKRQKDEVKVSQFTSSSSENNSMSVSASVTPKFQTSDLSLSGGALSVSQKENVSNFSISGTDEKGSSALVLSANVGNVSVVPEKQQTGKSSPSQENDPQSKRLARYREPHLNIGPEIGPDASCNLQCHVEFETVPLLTAPDGIRFDFAYGYRILIPSNAVCNYDVRIFDMNSGLLLDRFNLKPGDLLVGDRKYFIPYRLEIYKEGKPFFYHNYDCTGRRVYILVPDGGLGDNLAWVPMAEEFAKKYHADVCCVCGEWMSKLVGDLYPGLNFTPLINRPKLTEAYANYFPGIFDENMKNWRPVDHQFLGMQGAAESILGLPLKPVKCKLHTGSKRPFPERFVCISTMGTNPGKCWNFPDGWNIIIRKLKQCGYRVLDIDRDAQVMYGKTLSRIPSEAEDFTGRLSIQDRIYLLEHAEFFIGLPSGLSWLAWNVNIPVVMISGFTMPGAEFPTPYRVTNFLYCHGCWNDSSCFFDREVAVWCPKHSGTPREIECTKQISPKMVWETICKIPCVQEQLERLDNPSANAVLDESVSRGEADNGK